MRHLLRFASAVPLSTGESGLARFSRPVSFAAFTLLLLLAACSPPASTPEQDASRAATSMTQAETTPPLPDQPPLLTFDGTTQGIPVTARYPDVLEVSAMGSGEGVGVHFSFRPRSDALADAELHVFLPRGGATAEELLPFVTGQTGLMQSNGWTEVQRAPAGSGRFTQDWARTVIDFTAANDRSGHVVLGQTGTQAVQVTLLYPDALADAFWSSMTPVLDSLRFPTIHPAADADATTMPADSRLAGTGWTLVEIASMNDSVYRPVQGARYELLFEFAPLGEPLPDD